MDRKDKALYNAQRDIDVILNELMENAVVAYIESAEFVEDAKVWAKENGWTEPE